MQRKIEANVLIFWWATIRDKGAGLFVLKIVRHPRLEDSINNLYKNSHKVLCVAPVSYVLCGLYCS